MTKTPPKHNHRAAYYGLAIIAMMSWLVGFFCGFVVRNGMGIP